MATMDTAVLPGIKENFNHPQRKIVGGDVPLSAVAKGEAVRIKLIRGKNEQRRFLRNLGFIEDAEITVITELNGNVIVNIKGARIAISKAMANHIWTVCTN